MTAGKTARSAALASVGAAVAARYLLDSAVARSSSIELYADYALIMTLGVLVGSVAPMGLPEVGNRLVPNFLQAKRTAALRTYLRLTILLAIFVGLLLSVGVGAIAVMRSAQAETGAWGMLVALCLVAPSWAVINTRRAQALQLGRGNLVLFAPALSTALTVALLFMQIAGGSQMTLPQVAMWIALGNAGVALGICRPVRPKRIEGAPPSRHEAHQWLRQGAHVVSNAVASTLLTQGDIILIGFIVGPAEAGAYAAASRLALVVTMALGGLNPREAPILGRLVAQADYERAWQHYRHASLLSGLAGGMLCAVLLFFGGPILDIFVPGAAIAAASLSVLALGRLGSALVGPAAELLIALNGQRLVARSSWLGLTVGVILMTVLGSQFGALGVASGASGGMLVRSGLHYVFAKRVLVSRRDGGA